VVSNSAITKHLVGSKFEINFERQIKQINLDL